MVQGDNYLYHGIGVQAEKIGRRLRHRGVGYR